MSQETRKPWTPPRIVATNPAPPAPTAAGRYHRHGHLIMQGTTSLFAIDIDARAKEFRQVDRLLAMLNAAASEARHKTRPGDQGGEECFS